MPTLQEQIDSLDQMVLDLESSASGVIAYLLQFALDDYSTTAGRMNNDLDDFADELDKQIVAASGDLRIIKTGVMIAQL